MNGVIRVVAAVVHRNGRLLLCKRPLHKRHGGLWEFPGGKVEADESIYAAAHRELSEELGVEVTAVGELAFAIQDPGSPYVIEFHPVDIQGQPRCMEHTAIQWVNSGELLALPLAPSDRQYALHLAASSPEQAR